MDGPRRRRDPAVAGADGASASTDAGDDRLANCDRHRRDGWIDEDDLPYDQLELLERARAAEAEEGLHERPHVDVRVQDAACAAAGRAAGAAGRRTRAGTRRPRRTSTCSPDRRAGPARTRRAWGSTRASSARPIPPAEYAVGSREDPRVRAGGRRDEPAAPRRGGRARGRPRGRRGAADVRGRLQLPGAAGPCSSIPRSGSTSRAWCTAARSSTWGPLVVAGDEITTTASVADITERARQRLLRLRLRVGQRARRDGLLGTLVEHRAGRVMQPGDEIAPLAVTPDKYLTVRYAGASGDFNPIHIDEEFAQPGRPARAGSCTASTRWPRSRAPRPTRAAAPSRSSA